MSRIREESEKIIEDFAKAQLRFLRKINKKVDFTEEELFEIGRKFAMMALFRNIKKLKIKKKRVQYFGYEWQLEEVLKKEKSIYNYLRANYLFSEPKEF